MNKSLFGHTNYINIFLNPGEFYFGDQDTRIRTMLGSCVAITLWHPRLKIGGMCHYLLPSRHLKPETAELDGRYADEVMSLFLLELNKSGTWPADYEVKMFGGGHQFPMHAQTNNFTVPSHNIISGRTLLKKHGFIIQAEHLGGTGHRNVIFDTRSGEVWIKHVANYQEYV